MGALTKILFVTSFFTYLLTYSQNYDCNNISVNKMKKIYEDNKAKFSIYESKNDVMLYMLNKSENLFTQACINSWGESQQLGIKYLYERFISEYGYCTKEYYLQNIQYLEVLRTFNKLIKKNLNGH